MELDLSKFSKKELLEIAIKSEIDAINVYRELAKRTYNLILVDRLDFLAKEEEKHKKLLEKIFRSEFPGEEPDIPVESILPTPQIKVQEDMSLLDLIKGAMDAERASEEFYKKLAEQYTGEERELLIYLSAVEQGHYFILSNEYHLLKTVRDYDKILE